MPSAIDLFGQAQQLGEDQQLAEAKARIAELRATEANAVAGAQKWEANLDDKSSPAHLNAAAHWRTAADSAMHAHGYAQAYCENQWDKTSCLNVLDSPIGAWDGGKGKRAKDRAWYYYAWTDQHVAAAAAKGEGAPPPAKPPPVAVQKPGNGLAAPTTVLVDPTTGAELDPATGEPSPEPGAGSDLLAMVPGSTTPEKVGVLAVLAAVLYFGVRALGRR